MKSQGNRTLHGQLTRMNLALVLSTALLALLGALVITLGVEHQSVDLHLRESARIIAQFPQVRQALEGQDPADTIEILDGLIQQSPEIDIILVGDCQGQLYYAKDHTFIGSTYGGDAYRGALQEGEIYVVDETSLEEADRCAFAPVRGTDAAVVGFVAVGIYARSTLSLTLSTLAQFLMIAAIACALGLLLASRLSRRIKTALMGYEPEDFHRLFHRQQEVLDALEEGIMAIDRSGSVIFINQSATRLLELSSREDCLGRPVQRCERNTTLPRLLRTGRAEYNVPLDTPGGQILSDRVPIRQDGRIVGAVAIFRDRREVTRMAEDLTGIQHVVEAMRAYTHEFMNKLHVINGLLQMEQYDMARSYIMDITKTQQQAVSRVIGQIEDPTVAALLIGQISRASELGIHLVLDSGSSLGRDNRFLPSAAFVSILGNLIANAMDSLNHVTRRSKEITVSIRDSSEGLLLCVEDTGAGVESAVLPHLFEQGVSTKGAHRGTGLATVKELTDLYHGQIRLESQRGVGTVFYVSFHHPLAEEAIP